MKDRGQQEFIHEVVEYFDIEAEVEIDLTEQQDESSNVLIESEEQFIKRINSSLVHACQCSNAHCEEFDCQTVLHLKRCRVKRCNRCRRFMVLCVNHAKSHCQKETSCPVFLCSFFKEFYLRKQKEKDLRAQ
ncbi:Hypothetical predicted protein [Cloeon dipterum]|uniref:histone acetyltransferase n=1 Tax=Cloeon dipterum TaxID=197152 RepID=A0A8S1BW95_9INSE|nr:Hypothetical predicted protein [Cloeon dipterum]